MHQDKAISKAEASMTRVMGQITAGVIEELVLAPKKRLGTDPNAQVEGSDVEINIGLEAEDMQEDEHNEGLSAAENSVHMQSNRLFVDNIVMAGSENQT
ncbi:hypothetical protein A2U01_0044227, partial [Trifolium medium]|nr:hypothetical protein [Trifolium medium]